MPVLAQFSPAYQQANPTDTFFKAQDQRMSMMERAQQQKQNDLALQMMEQKKLQWDVEAPVRIAEMQSKMAAYGADLALRKRNAELEAEFAQLSPQIYDDFQKASIPPVGPDGKPNYAQVFNQYTDIAGKYAKFSILPTAKPFFDVLKNTQDVTGAYAAKQLQYNGALQKRVIDNKLMLVDPTTGSMTEAKGAYPDAAQAAAIAAATAQGKASGTQAVTAVDTEFNLAKEAMARLSKLQLMKDTMAKISGGTGITYGPEEQLRSIGRAMGWGDEKELSNMQFLKQQMESFQLDAAERMKGQGQITENERLLLRNAIMNSKYTSGANQLIINTMAKIDERQVKKANYLLSLQEQGLTPLQLALKAKAWELNPSNQIDWSEIYRLQGSPSKESEFRKREAQASQASNPAASQPAAPARSQWLQSIQDEVNQEDTDNADSY